MAKFFIDPAKTYNLPEELSIREINGMYLVIAPQTANWIVLKSLQALEVLQYFSQGASIAEVSEKFSKSLNDVREVVTQLEGRNFCNKKVSSATEAVKSLHIYITNKCNLSCPHCYMFYGVSNDDELKTSEILQLLDDYKNSGGCNITLSGGEPSIRTDFNKIVIAASELGLKVRILSNGMLWSRERIDALAPHIDSIQISIDGFSENTNSIIRGEGHFSKALSTIDEFIKKKVNVSVAITPPFTLLKEHIDEYCNFGLKLASKYRGSKLLIKFSEGLLNGRDICPSKDTNNQYYELMQTLQKKFHGPKYDVLSFARANQSNIIMDNCMFGVYVIASNGDVYLCARTSDLKPVANIRTNTFEEIKEISHKAEYATKIHFLKPCSSCDLRYICGGGCRIDEFNEIVNRTDFDNIEYATIPHRKCSAKMRDKFYHLMIDANPYLFKYPQ